MDAKPVEIVAPVGLSLYLCTINVERRVLKSLIVNE